MTDHEHELIRPEDAFRFEFPELLHDAALAAVIPAPPPNLPAAPNPLVGRETELSAIVELLRRERLVTLTGPAGSGKTRLALQAGSEVMDDFKDGVWWVSLAALRDSDLVEPTIAQVLGVKDELIEQLRQKRMLLLLDNFEQVVDAAPVVAALLGAAPDVRVLVTSRERLAIAAEHEYVVPTMEQPEALELFAARARQIKSDFEADDAVAEICLRLDGLPLAIELAAARIKLLRPEQILERLGHSLDVLTGGRRDAPERQRTLRAAIEWSYDLLDEEEQRVFAVVSAFVGGFTLEAADAVAGADLDTLESLLEKSLLRQEEGRLAMLGTIREFALERLDASPDAESVFDRHCRYFAERAAQASDLELHDIREALDRASRIGDDELLARATVELAPFLLLRGHLVEGRRRLELAIERGTDVEIACRGLSELAEVEFLLGENNASFEHAERAVSLARTLGDQALELRALTLGASALWPTAPESSERRLSEVADLSRSAGDAENELNALSTLAPIALGRGEVDRAREISERALALARDIRDEPAVAITTFHLGFCLLAEDRFADAEPFFGTALRIGVDLGWPEGIVYPIGALAVVAMHRGDPRRAARLLGAATAMQEQVGLVLSLVDVQREMYEQTARAAREALGDSFDEAFESGRTLDVKAAVAEALCVA